MSVIDSHLLQHSSVFSVYSDREEIQVSPDYQREGEVWNLEKKQLLIDSIINRFDIPKIYFHKLDKSQSKKYEYAVIDGKQRLEAIWGFMDGVFPLGDKFVYLRDESVDLSGLTYQDLTRDYPKIRNKFDSMTLPIVVVETDDLDLIDDMFGRLNEAVPLNAAEKRNSIRGYCISEVTSISQHQFFNSRVRFSPKRYRHREVAIRLLFIEHSTSLPPKKIIDTKKVYLDDFANEYRKSGKAHIQNLGRVVTEVLDALVKVFTAKDVLLAAQASIPVYYLVYKELLGSGEERRFTRKRLSAFNDRRRENRELAERNIGKADYELLEFDRMSVQGTNDSSSIRERVRILLEFIRSHD